MAATLSSRASDCYIRLVLAFVIFASDLKYVGLGTTTLGWVLCGLLLGAALTWALSARPWREAVPDQASP